MKTYTHIAFSTGVACYVASALGIPLNVTLLIGVFAGLMQLVIDVLSHETVYTADRVIHRRTPLLHSPTGALLVAVGFTALSAYVTRPQLPLLLLQFLAMIVASYSHLLLDLLTERGIYVKGKRAWRKRLFSYNNPLLNFLFTVTGIALFLASLQLHLQPHP